MTEPLDPGIYELLVTADLEARLRELDEKLEPRRASLHEAEAANRVALHLSRVIERAIATIEDSKRAELGIRVARELVRRIDELLEKADAQRDTPTEPGSVLRSILGRNADGSPSSIETPLIPLLDTTLLTNAPDEPRVGRQVQAEIESADGIDLLMAFIRVSGIRPMRDKWRRHREGGRTLRVLTTTYTGSTERRALDLLRELGADIRVSYDKTSTRLHAKAWIFHRRTGFSTAYIGSSNLTHSAQVSGLEWNVRVSGARNPDVIEKMAAVFESYWASDDFRPYDSDEFERIERREKGAEHGATFVLSPVEVHPRPFQQRLLEQIAVCRKRGRHRNLLVAATGTGKTVMAALDYARLRAELPRARLLFVAHRKEILDQSRATFRQVLRDASFGEAWVAGDRPRRFDHVFASVQSLHTTDLENLAPDHFDIVIVDEFHHAAASSYTRLLDHVHPRELLGLTATPERADGLPILHWFDDRIAAELRLWDAIDQHHLSPFLYFGIADEADLRQVAWRPGTGYDATELAAVYTASGSWARSVARELLERVDDPSSMRVLGYCVSIEHAKFMARAFDEAGIRSTAVWGESTLEEREKALSDLRSGRLRVLFSVDLFNEGVDLPTVDTLLLSRPTDSPVLFLQQLGRGLRRAPGKTACTVLDFVGHHRKEFRFDRRFRALLGGTRKDVEDQVKGGFPYLPAGCHMELDPVASDRVLRSIREATPTLWKHKVDELRKLDAAGHDATLANYVHHTGLDLAEVFIGNRSWSDLRQEAGLAVLAPGPDEKQLRRAIGRLLHVDDDVRLEGYLDLLGRSSPPQTESLGERERRLLRMLVAPMVDRVVRKTATLQDGVDVLWSHRQVVSELRELFEMLRDPSTGSTIPGESDVHLHTPLPRRPEVPLQIHARYTRLEILAAFGVGRGAKVTSWQQGVRWLEDDRADLLAFTLDKTDGAFSPTTRYRDYAINRELIHWESQSITRADSDTGRRYRNHEAQGSDILLFARLRQSDRAFWFLGPASYVRHTGERPMAITWRLAVPLPGDLFTRFAAAVA